MIYRNANYSEGKEANGRLKLRNRTNKEEQKRGKKKRPMRDRRRWRAKHAIEAL
jgi:hypothetical protein